MLIMSILILFLFNLLTKKTKKMTRTEMFDYIRKNNLQDEVKKMFGKNFTNVKSNLLADFIETDKAAKTESKNSSKKITATKATSVVMDSKDTADYTKLKHKYDCLIGTVAVMLCSIDNEDTAHDLQDAINNIQASLSKD